MIVLPTALAEMKESSSVFFIELYIVRLQDTTLYFAACDEDIPWFIPGTNTPVVYKAFPVERETINSSVDNALESTTLRLSNVDDSFTVALFSGFDFTNKIVDILTIAYPDSLTDSNAFNHDFRGYMDAPKLVRKKGTFEVQLKSLMPECQPGRSFMLSCNAVFGDPEDCGASTDKQVGRVQSGSTTREIRIEQSRSLDYWRYGILTVGNESREVEGNSGNKITIRYPFYGTPTGNYSISCGCDKTRISCKQRNNIQNFSGFPAIPFELVIKS